MRKQSVASAACVLLAASAHARSGAPAFDVVERTIPELQAAMAAGSVTARQLVELSLARIDAYDRRGPRLQSLITLNPRALLTAAELDRERGERGPRGPLHGIPVVVKDNFDTADMPTTGGSLALATLRPQQDAFQVRKLREAGAVIIGKTNLHELASGITTISSYGGQTRNPYDPTRNPGGSSGGTGAAIAASFAVAGLGSDTCGSIRIPASHNNLFGLRSTSGLASRAGVMPLSHTQDVAGPLARSVTDLAILLDTTVAPDPADPTTSATAFRLPNSYREALREKALAGARIGVLKQLFGDAPEDEEAGSVVRKALEAMSKQGAQLLDVSVPGLEELLRDSSVIDTEFKFDLADYLGRMPDAPVMSLRQILEGGLYDAALETALRRRDAVEERENERHRKALVKRRAARAVVRAAFEEHRVVALAYPTMRRKPAPIGEPQRGSNCQLSATTGLPAFSLPAGFSDDGLPVGIELLGDEWREAELLALGYSYEQAARPRRAPISTPPLVDGKAPPPIVFHVSAAPISEAAPGAAARLTGRMSFDRSAGVLTYSVEAQAIAAEEILTASVHRGAPGRSGALVARLLDAEQARAAGSVTLRPRDQEELLAGRLYVQLYTRRQPLGAARAQLTPGP